MNKSRCAHINIIVAHATILQPVKYYSLTGVFCTESKHTPHPAPGNDQAGGRARAARFWVHGRRDEEKQVEGMHQGNPLPDICTTSTRGSPAALHMIPDISRPHSPRLRPGECWNLYLFSIRQEALRRKGLRGFLSCWTSHGRRGIGAGAGDRKQGRRCARRGEDSPGVCPPHGRPAGETVRRAGGGGFSLP